jgi:hypothetical protein
MVMKSSGEVRMGVTEMKFVFAGCSYTGPSMQQTLTKDTLYVSSNKVKRM